MPGPARPGASALKLAWSVPGAMVVKIEGLRHSRNPSPATQTLYQSIPSPGSNRPALRVSSRVARPVLAGPLHPAILIPTELDRPEAAEPLRLNCRSGSVCFTNWFTRAVAAPGSGYLTAWCGRTGSPCRRSDEFGYKCGSAGNFSPTSRRQAGPAPSGPKPRRRWTWPAPRPASSRRSIVAKGGLDGPALSIRVLMLVRCPFPIDGHPDLAALVVAANPRRLDFGCVERHSSGSATVGAPIDRARCDPAGARRLSIGQAEPRQPAAESLPCSDQAAATLRLDDGAHWVTRKVKN